MKTIALSALWFLCGAAWLNPGMLTYVWTHVGRPYLIVRYHGNVVYESCVDRYHTDNGWVYIDDLVHEGEAFAFKADQLGVAYGLRLCAKP